MARDKMNSKRDTDIEQVVGQTWDNKQKIKSVSKEIVTIKEELKDSSSSGSSGAHQVLVLDFITDEETKAKVIARDITQNKTVVTSAIDAAFAELMANDKEEMVFGDGLYLTNGNYLQASDQTKEITFTGFGATIQHSTAEYIFRFRDTGKITIMGFHFTSSATSYIDANFLLIDNNIGFAKVFNNRFTKFPGTAITSQQSLGGVESKGLTITHNEFTDASNYGNVGQTAIALNINAEYSKIAVNNFHSIPSAIRFIGSANCIFTLNNCLAINGSAGTDRGIIYSEAGDNSGKMDITYNKINHTSSGISAIVLKGDPLKPQNSSKIIGNDILVHEVGVAIYIHENPSTIIRDNVIRGATGVTGATAIFIVYSDEVLIEGNHLQDYSNGITLSNSSGAKVGTNNYKNITVVELNYDSLSSNYKLIDGTASQLRLAGALTLENLHNNTVLYNYGDSSLALTLDELVLKADFNVGLDAISEDITILEGTNTFLPSGDKTILAGEYARMYRIENYNIFRFLNFGSIGGVNLPQVIADGAAEIAAIISRATTEGFTQPSAPTQVIMQTLIAKMINSGMWVKLDFINMSSYNDLNLKEFSRINWKTPLDPLMTEVGTVSYTINGYQGTNSPYWNTQNNPFSYGGNFTQDDASLTAVVHTTSVDAGVCGTNGFQNSMNNSSTHVNHLNNIAKGGTPNLSGTGLISMCRNNAANMIATRQATSVTVTSVSSGIDNESMKLLKNVNNPGAVGIGMFMMGADINVQLQQFRADYNLYLHDIGLNEFA